MRAAAVLPFVAVGAYAQAQNATYLAGLLKALNDAGLTSLATTAAAINSTDLGKHLLTILPTSGPLTIFAPNNDAFGKVPQDVSSNANLLANIISYHVAPGNYSGVAATAPNVTIGATLLNDSSLVQLEGNKSQVIAWQSQTDQKVHILNQASDVTVQSTAAYENLIINVIPEVLVIPGNITTVLTANGLTTLATVASGIPGVLEAVSALKGFTLFAPNNDGLTAASAALAGLSGNNSALTTVILNHLVNGSTIYSPSVSPSAKLTSAAGEQISFQTNSSGIFVVSGDNVASAKLVRTDLLVDRGVVHIIDGVLANTASNAAAASSAAASATSIAGKPTGTGTSGTAGSSGSAKPTSGAISLMTQGGAMSGVIAGLVGVLGAFAGGLLVL